METTVERRHLSGEVILVVRIANQSLRDAVYHLCHSDN